MLSYFLNSSSIMAFQEPITILGPKLKYKIVEVVHEFRQIVDHLIANSYLNKNDEFFLYTRVRRFTLYGSITLRKVSEEILPTIHREFMKVIAMIDPNLRMNHRVYRRVLLKLNKKLTLIPYNKTWPPPVFPTTLWTSGYILKKLNDIH